VTDGTVASSATERPSAAGTERRALLLGFTVFGAFWGAWVAALPDLRRQVGVDDGLLGLALGAIALSALPAMPLAGRLVDRRGPGSLLRLSLAAFAVTAVLPALATGLLPLVLALLALGAATGVLDVLLNTATAAWERLEGRRLMAAAHGCFSLGLLLASVATGLARDLGATPLVVLSAAGLVVLLAARVQPRHRSVLDSAARRSGAAVPGRLGVAGFVLVLGVLTGIAFLIEDAVQSWSALHLERTLGAEPWLGGLGPGLFAGAMAVGRFSVHLVAGRLRDWLVIGVGATVVTVGLLLLALAPSAPVALAGMTVAGAGVSVLAPTLFSAVGDRSAPGRQGADLALVTAIGYAGFVLGPPLIGLLSAATTLPTALALLAVLPAAVAVLGPLALRAPTQPAPPGQNGGGSSSSSRRA
jgi:MFS family permease